MHRALPLAVLALVAAGCGGRAYSDADVVAALGTSHVGTIEYSQPGSPPFATLAAVTDLRIESGPAWPLAVYDGGDVRVARYATPHDARIGGAPPMVFVTVNAQPPVFVHMRRGNLVFVGRRRAVDAAVARLP
jgi:hypothetical protein